LALSGLGITSLSGCTGSESLPAESDDTDSEGGTKTEVEDTTVNVGSFDYPEGVSEGGVSDAERLHEQVVDNVDTTSFTFDYGIETTNDDSYEVSSTALYDPESAEGLIRVQGATDERSVNYAIYHSGSMVYLAEQIDGNHEYSTYDRSTDENRFSRRTARDSAIEGVDFIETFTYAVDGVEAREGRAVAVLPITGAIEGEDAWLSDPDGALYLNEAAWPVEFRWEGTNGQGTLEANGGFSDVGSTTVEKPEWVQDAKEAGDS